MGSVYIKFLLSVMTIIPFGTSGYRILDKNSPSICLDCVEKIQKKVCHLPFCPENFNTCKHQFEITNRTETNNLSPPKLLCHDENSLTLAWNQKNAMEFYFLKYSHSSEIYLSDLSNCNFKTINLLEPDTTYQFELWSFSRNSGILSKSSQITVTTRNHFEPRHPVESLKYTLLFQNGFYSAVISWKQGKGKLKRAVHIIFMSYISDFSCFYKIIWYKRGGSINHRKINVRNIHNITEEGTLLEFIASPLEMGTKYYLEISSEDEKSDIEGPEKSLQINVPSCLATYKNFSICSPNPPENITATKFFTSNGTKMAYNLKLSWNKPKYLPDFYNVTLASNISVQFKVIAGNTTFVFFENLSVGIYYQTRLTAWLKNGKRSNPVSMQIFDNKRHNIEEKNTINTWIWMVLGLFVLVIFLSITLLKKNLRKILNRSLHVSPKVEEITVKYAKEDSIWEIDESKLLMDKIIGIGAFGIVQKAHCYVEGEKKIEIAVKMLKERSTEEQLKQFYAEIDIMKAVPKHPHIVHLIGVVTKTRQNNPLLLVEYCSKGDLHTFLKNVWLILKNKDNMKMKKEQDKHRCVGKEENVLEWKDLLSFARQIAIGMEFLCSLKMIHRDLAARNILVTESNTMKISDFGLSRDVYVNNMYQKLTGGKLPFRWMALESLTHQIYTAESDVWSFGIVLWEIVTLGAGPYPALDTEDLLPLLKEGYRMEKPANCSEELYAIMLKCWNATPSLRPTFTELRKIFDVLLESEVFYVNLDSGKSNGNRYENLPKTIP
ncbi:tyrosine-protein kinase receptor torso isoform X2 [Sitophilus oryzae]|uniref:receptor protein-tyrosine kinase n=1 Tax=Sitophilus oryzae TaxID=7048 RepID=A0A6J2Y554_SITOR|nr:tyrosine-protein kinase receptor torso isoform X2 [Sitophilus oryzae]